MDVGTLRQAAAVLLVFSLLGLALWKLRQPGVAFCPPWRKTGAKARSLESIERLALTPQHALHLVRVQGREVVVATHPHGCTLLAGCSEQTSFTAERDDREAGARA
jgi:flagellar biogenesis protein FliO